MTFSKMLKGLTDIIRKTDDTNDKRYLEETRKQLKELKKENKSLKKELGSWKSMKDINMFNMMGN